MVIDNMALLLSSKANTYIPTQRNSVNVPRGGGCDSYAYLPGH